MSGPGKPDRRARGCIAPGRAAGGSSTLSDRKLEEQLALLLSAGTWIACAVIGLGLVAMLGVPEAGARPGAGLVTAGVVIFVLLPAVRVAWMLLTFTRAGAYRFTAVAALVLAAIAAGFAVGVM